MLVTKTDQYFPLFFLIIIINDTHMELIEAEISMEETSPSSDIEDKGPLFYIETSNHVFNID